MVCQTVAEFFDWTCLMHLYAVFNYIFSLLEVAGDVISSVVDMDVCEKFSYFLFEQFPRYLSRLLRTNDERITELIASSANA